MNASGSSLPIYTYASTQATKCASCGEYKHTPLRIDAMDGYVCLTCIDKKLCGLLGEFGYPADPDREAIRNEVLDSALDIIQQARDNICAGGLAENRQHEESVVRPYLDSIYDEVNDLKSQPAQPSDFLLPADWSKDSSLETWFPLTADQLKRQEEEIAALKAQLAAHPTDNQALLRGRAQDEGPRVKHSCNMGVGCEEAGVCYAESHGEPERCGRIESDSQAEVSDHLSKNPQNIDTSGGYGDGVDI